MYMMIFAGQSFIKLREERFIHHSLVMMVHLLKSLSSYLAVHTVSRLLLLTLIF